MGTDRPPTNRYEKPELCLHDLGEALLHPVVIHSGSERVPGLRCDEAHEDFP